MDTISRQIQNQRGMTLLELLLVVTILSAVAWMSLGSVSNNTQQIRFEDTRNRLNAIRESILGSSSVKAWEKGLQSGYVVDNGLLPTNIDNLVNVSNVTGAAQAPATSYDIFGTTEPLPLPLTPPPHTPRSPRFDPVPDPVSGINNGPVPGGSVGDEIELIKPEQQLQKGHRGYYLTGTTNNNGSRVYRDGWGTDRILSGATAIDCPSISNGAGSVEGDDREVDAFNNPINHGWCVTTPKVGVTTVPREFYIDSYGMDGQAGAVTGDPDYEPDIAMGEPVLADDWQTDVSGQTVNIVNLSGDDIGTQPPTSTSLSVSLLVYINDADQVDQNNWRRVTSGLALDSCLDGSDADTDCGGSAAPQNTTVTFTTTTPIPIGEHLLVLVHDPDRSSAGDDTVDIPNSGLSPTIQATNRIKFFSRTGTPEMVIEIH